VENVGEIEVVVERLVSFKEDNRLRVATEEEKMILKKMREVFESEEWMQVPGLKAQDRRKVNREVKPVDQGGNVCK
jgi:hypothetical protein